jgi:formate hydrogenlyase transcriptional activator
MREAQRSSAESLKSRYEILLDLPGSISSYRDLPELFHHLAAPLHRAIEFEFINVILHDPERNKMVSHVLETPDPSYACPSTECPMEAAAESVRQSQQPWALSGEEHEGRFPELITWLNDRGIKSLCLVALTTAMRRMGALAFGSSRPGVYAQPEIEFLQQVAKQVALAVDNALNFEQAQAGQKQLTEERDRLSLVLEVNNAVISALNLQELLTAVSASLRRFVHHEYASISLYDAQTDRLHIHALDFPVSKGLIQQGLSVPVKGSPTGRALTTRQAVFITRREVEQFGTDIAQRILAEGLLSACCLPLVSHGRPLGTLVVASLREEEFPRQDAEMLRRVADQIAIAVENALAFGQVVDKANKLAEEKLYLQDEIRSEHNFDEIVGESSTLRKVLQQAKTVAATDSTVLLRGETGTGKELIARAIHNLSGRRELALVKVNCAAIPTGLLESELFGHEKGAFTGAIAQRIGRFELAHRGTLFLDEVGDIPLELQPKLLRVLQEQEFERLGSTRTQRVDVRLIAATNADLPRLISEKQFRSDLYYRLNVFPIVIPPLRERREDIPVLVRYFAQKYARRMKKHIDSIAPEAMKALCEYPWPGNVRELENFIERAVILSSGSDLRFTIGELNPAIETAESKIATTLEDAEREHILKALEETGWVVGGASGAAARLGMKRTTLQSRIKNLGITRSK